MGASKRVGTSRRKPTKTRGIKLKKGRPKLRLRVSHRRPGTWTPADKDEDPSAASGRR